MPFNEEYSSDEIVPTIGNLALDTFVQADPILEGARRSAARLLTPYMSNFPANAAMQLTIAQSIAKAMERKQNTTPAARALLDCNINPRDMRDTQDLRALLDNFLSDLELD